MGKLNSKQRQALPDNIFGIPEDRSYPMPDAKHVKSAISFFHKAPENKKKELAKNIARRVKELNIKVVGNCQYMRYLSPSKESSGFNGIYGYNRINESTTKIINMPTIKKNNGYTIKGGMVASLPKKNIDMNASNIGTLSPIVPLNQEPPLQQGPSIDEDYLDGDLDDSMFVSDSEFADNVEDLIASLKHSIYIEEKTQESSINYGNDIKKNFTLEDYQRDLYSQICSSVPDDAKFNSLSNEKLDRKIDFIMKTKELKDLYNYMTKPCKNRPGTYTNDYSVFGIYLRQTIIDILDSDLSDGEIAMKIIRLLPCSLKKDDLFWNLYPVKMKKSFDLFKKILNGYMDKLIAVKNSNGTKLQDLIGSISEFNNFIYKDKPLALYLNLDKVVKDNKEEKRTDRTDDMSSCQFIALASHNFPEYLLGKNKHMQDIVTSMAFHIAYTARLVIEDTLRDLYHVSFACPVYRTSDLPAEWRYDIDSNAYDYDDLDLVFHDINNFRNVVNELYMTSNYCINYPSFDSFVPFTFYTLGDSSLIVHFFYMLRDRNDESHVKICEYKCTVADVKNDNGRWKLGNIPIRYSRYPIMYDSPSFYTFKDFALEKETIGSIIADSVRCYHDCDIQNPESVKDAIKIMAKRVPDISDYYFKLIPHYKDIMTMDYLSTESTKIVKEASVKKFMNRLKDTISGIEISDKGDIKIDLRDKLSFKNYEEIHSVLKENQKSHNYDAMKENIAYIFSLINTLDSLYVDAGKGRNKKEIKKDDEYYEMMRLRALFISDFKTYLRIIQKHDPKFNFLEYYKTSPANTNTVTIKGTTIKKLGMLFKSIIL